MDLVFVLGTGSQWQDNELRFSLRSIETYIEDLGTVYLVGPKPKWLTNVVHLPFSDRFTCKERNIMLKLAYACGHPDLSTNFLHVHDDHFALFPQKAAEMPNYCSRSLEKTAESVKAKKPGNHWWQSVWNTHKVLSQKSLPTRNFDLHYPMIFNKEIYPEIMDRYNWKEPRGYVVKSLYGNTAGINPTISGDLKINYRARPADIVSTLKGKKWFSIGNDGLTGDFKKFLQAFYPEPSRFELRS